MKIKVEKDKLVHAVRKLEGIEIVLEDEGDAKEALELVLGGPSFLSTKKGLKLQETKVTKLQEYSDSAVSYKLMFLLEFSFMDEVAISEKVSFIKELQDYFSKL